MPKAINGGAAYPRPAVIHPDSGRVLINDQGGMSLRDHFAGLAMQAIITANGDAAGCCYYDRAETAKESYATADAMIKARDE